MTGTERLALVVLVVAATAGGVAYTLRDAGTSEPIAERGSVVDAPREDAGRRPHDAPMGALPRGPRSGDGGSAGAGGGGDRRGAAPKPEGVVGVRPEPRRAWEGGTGADRERDADFAPPDVDSAGSVPVGASGAAPREVAPPVAGHQPGAVAAADQAETVAEADRKPDADPDVLLSIPLRGAVEPDAASGPPPQTSGLVMHGGEVEFTEDAQYTLPSGGNVNSDAGTISFAIEPNWTGDDDSNNSLLQIRDEHRWENSLGIVKNFNSLRYIIHDELGVETNVNVYIDQWQPNERHVVTATWDDTRMTLSVDGEQVGESPLPNPVRFGDSTPMHVGSDFPGSSYRGANARISDLTVRSTAPPAGP